MKPRIIFTALLMVGASLFVAACGGNIQPVAQAENAVGALGNFLVPQSTREIFREEWRVVGGSDDITGHAYREAESPRFGFSVPWPYGAHNNGGSGYAYAILGSACVRHDEKKASWLNVAMYDTPILDAHGDVYIKVGDKRGSKANVRISPRDGVQSVRFRGESEAAILLAIQSGAPLTIRIPYATSSPYEDVVFDKYEGAENALKEVADFCAD